MAGRAQNFRNGSGITFPVFWSILSVAIAAIGSLFFMIYSHSGQAKHPEAANEKDVTILAIKVGAIESNVENIQHDVQELRVEQRVYTDTILRAIREDE